MHPELILLCDVQHTFRFSAEDRHCQYEDHSGAVEAGQPPVSPLAASDALRCSFPQGEPVCLRVLLLAVLVGGPVKEEYYSGPVRKSLVPGAVMHCAGLQLSLVLMAKRTSATQC